MFKSDDNKWTGDRYIPLPEDDSDSMQQVRVILANVAITIGIVVIGRFVGNRVDSTVTDFVRDQLTQSDRTTDA